MSKRVNSWHDIPDKTINDFVKMVERLRKKMIPRDSDNDSAVEVTIIDRRKYESFHYQPIPYSHDIGKLPPDKQEELEEEIERWLTCNLSMASDALDRWLKMRSYRQQRRRLLRQPLEVQIAAACVHCRNNVGFKDGDEALAQAPGMAKRDPFKPSPTVDHLNGKHCDAWRLRVNLYYQKKGKTQPYPPEEA